MNDLRAPFPYFGGKRRVADVVWRAFGPDINNYVEPFFGSGAVLLARPGGAGKIETVNDACAYLTNFWRAVTAVPDEVARWADYPVSELDLHARHKWLVNQSEFRERMRSDPDFYDAKVAGYWCWGICQWIGGGWCVEPNNHKHPKLDGIGKGVHSDAGHGKERNLRARQRPRMSGDHAGDGVHSERATRGRRLAGRGVHEAQAYSPGRRPQLAGAGQGVHLPSLGNDRGLNGVAAAPCVQWFRDLQARLRRVRIACGDWTRVLGNSVLGKGKNVGGRRPCAVFLDPPYSFEFRDPYLYSEDDAKISEQVRAWALEHGDDPDLRICLAGYWDEHREAMPPTWRAHRWKAARGYASTENSNREQETLWFSPHCLAPAQASLFSLERSSA